MTVFRSLVVAMLGTAVGFLGGWLGTRPVAVTVQGSVERAELKLPIPDGLLAAADARAQLRGWPAVVSDAGSGAGVKGPVVVATAEAAGRVQPVRKLFAAVARHRVSTELQKKGFAEAGGDPTPLSKEAADREAERLTDRMILAAGEVYDAPVGGGDGSVLNFVLAVLNWLAEHKEFISFLLGLLMVL